MEFGRLLDMVPAPAADIRSVDAIDGWMAYEAGDLSIRLGHLQTAMRSVAGVLELGVFKGKYLALLAQIFQGSGVPVVGIDAFIAHIGVMVDPKQQQIIMEQITQRIMSIAPESSQPTLLAEWTTQVSAATLRRLSPNGYSFISVDAGHEAADVENDLGLAEAAMSQDAVIAADDVFNPKVPGVMEGMCRYFAGRPDSAMAPFAWSGNKVFMSSRSRHDVYLAYMKWLMSHAVEAPYIARAAELDSTNRRSRFVPRLFGHEIVTFEWN